jgi:hypothetical protein
MLRWRFSSFAFAITFTVRWRELVKGDDRWKAKEQTKGGGTWTRPGFGPWISWMVPSGTLSKASRTARESGRGGEAKFDND